jgi:MFS transporter, ACS family, glucarate transporter
VDKPASSRTRVGLVFILFLLSAVAFLDRTNLSVAGVQMRREYHLDPVHLGWIFSAFLIGYALFQVPAGWLAGRLGPRIVLTGGVVWWGVFTALVAAVSPRFGSPLVQLLLIRFALGAGESVVYPAGNQFLSRWIPVQERGTANGWIFAGVGAGAGLTPPLVTFIMTHYGWRASFYTCAVVGVAVGVVWYLLSRDRPEEHPSVSAAELEHIHAGLHPDARGARPPTPWGAIFASKEVWGLFVSYFAFGYVIWLFFSWFFIYLADARHLDLKSSALFSMLPFIAMTLFCLGGGVINDRISKRRGLFAGRCGTAVVSFILTAIFLVAGSAVHNAALAVVILAGGAGSIYLSQSSFWAATTDFAGPHTGVVSGFMNMGCQIGGAITSSLTPWIAAQFGWTAAFVAAAALALIGAVAWLFVDPTRPLVRPATARFGPSEEVVVA